MSEANYHPAGSAAAGDVLQWTPEVSLDQMEAAGVARAILSMSTPGSWFGSVEDGRRMSREINECAAQMMRDHPGRFGLFAAIPLPDTEGSLKEIEYAFGTLQADGIGLMTSYDTVPVGDKSFAPVFEELNRREAIIFLHRTAATCCLNLRHLPNNQEFIVDDLRAINSLLTSGTLARFPNIRWIHADGDKTLPWLAQLSGVADSHGKPMDRPLGGRESNPAYAPQGVLNELRKVYVDTAGNSQDTMDDLRELGMMDRIMFGTDHPYGGQNAIASNRQRLLSFKLSQTELDAIGRETAVRVFPKFKA